MGTGACQAGCILLASLSASLVTGLFTNASALCSGKSVVAPQADWLWSTAAVPSPSCTSPAIQNVARMCEGDVTSVVMEGSGQPQCLSAHMDCYFNMHDLTQLDFDVQMVDCKGVWAAPLWMDPNHWEGGGKSGEIDMLENCPSKQVHTQFAGGGKPVAWPGSPDDYAAHTTVWKKNGQNGTADIFVRSCSTSEAQHLGECVVGKKTAQLKDIYGKNGCTKGDCVYKMVSDIWNGLDGNGGYKHCMGGKPHLSSSGCKFSVTNIKTKGVRFTGKCAALAGDAPAPSPPSPAACDANPGCAGLVGNCCPADDGTRLACCSSPSPAPPPTPSPAPPPSPSPSPSAACGANPGCAGLVGNCCPADDGTELACCSSAALLV